MLVSEHDAFDDSSPRPVKAALLGVVPGRFVTVMPMVRARDSRSSVTDAASWFRLTSSVVLLDRAPVNGNPLPGR